MENINLAVLWDMDGTILDTLELHYLTWKEAFSDRPTLFSRELFRANFGGNNHSTVPIYLGYEPDEAYYQHVVALKETLFREQLAEKPGFSPAFRIGLPTLPVSAPGKPSPPPPCWRTSVKLWTRSEYAASLRHWFRGRPALQTRPGYFPACRPTFGYLPRPLRGV